MVKGKSEDANLWRYEDLIKSKKKPIEGSYEDDIENLYSTMKKGVKVKC